MAVGKVSTVANSEYPPLIMKILFVSNYFPPFYFGGYELKCKQLSGLLTERGHETFILTGNYQVAENPDLPEEDNVSRILHYDQPADSAWQRHKVSKWNYRKTREIIRKFQPDIIYLWNQRDLTLGPSYAACNSGLPKMYQVGDFWQNTYIKPGRKAALRRKISSIIPLTLKGKLELHPAIVVGGWMVREMKDKFDAEEVHHIPRGVIIPDEPDYEKQLHPTPKFLFTGRIDPEKGLDVAIKAFALLHERKQIGDFVFNIVGGGDEKCIAECRQLAMDSGLGDKIHFLGKSREMAGYYASHTIFIMPTLMREAFGIVTIEAMCQGTVPIVSDGYGPREIVQHGENGLRFETGNSEKLAESILQLLQNPELRYTLAKAGRKTVETKYTLEQEISRVETLLLQHVHPHSTAS